MRKMIIPFLGLMLCSCAAATAADTSSQAEQPSPLETQQAEITAAQTKETHTCEEAAQAIMSEVEFPTMVEVTADKAGMYIDASIPDGTDFAMYICGSGGFADEILLAKGDALDEDALASAAKKRIEERKDDFVDYNPDEAVKFDDALILSGDGYFMYFITADNEKCADTAHEMLF